MKFYITKYALSGGIFAIESEAVKDERDKDGQYSVKDTRSRYWHAFNEREAFADRAAAIADAEQRRSAKIASLEKQIGKLKKLTFDVKD